MSTNCLPHVYYGKSCFKSLFISNYNGAVSGNSISCSWVPSNDATTKCTEEKHASKNENQRQKTQNGPEVKI